MAFPTFSSLARACLRPAGLALGVWLATVTGPAMAQGQAPLTPEQRKAIVDLVRETIVKNPEIIQDALVELERRNTVAQAEAQRGAVAAEKARISDPATSVIIGNPEGDLTLVEFMDYNCGFCKRAMQDVTALSKAEPAPELPLGMRAVGDLMRRVNEDVGFGKSSVADGANNFVNQANALLRRA